MMSLCFRCLRKEACKQYKDNEYEGEVIICHAFVEGREE
jgi:hypothetical protein